MAVRLWLHEYDAKRLNDYRPENLEHYSGEGQEELVTTEIEPAGFLSHLKSSFVLGKVLFWKNRKSSQSTPFVRIDNHRAYGGGMVLSPLDWIDVRFHRHRKTIDQRTKLTRVQLLAPDNDFIRRVFVTYGSDALVCKPTDLEQHLLVYCDSRHLFEGRVGKNP